MLTAAPDAWVCRHFSAALLARDLGDLGSDPERTFEFGLTYDRDVVAVVAQALLGRVVPRLPVPPGLTSAGAAVAAAVSPADLAAEAADAAADLLLRRALSATSNGVTIADVARPDAPLVYVSTAFERLFRPSCRGGAGAQLRAPARRRRVPRRAARPGAGRGRRARRAGGRVAGGRRA